MKIAIFVDKPFSAIDRLAQIVVKYNPHFDIKIFYVHPKRNDADSLFQAQDALKWADLIDVHYWKSGLVLKTTFAVYFENKPKILCHFNLYDLEKEDWKEYKQIVVGNQTQQNLLPRAILIPYAINLDFFRFNEQYTEEKIVNMTVARIESKKGVLEVAQACKDLGYKLRIVGRVSDGEYMQSVLDVGGDITFIENATEEILRDEYYKAAVHICNSTDDFESGTLPILEAMACGMPVLTRNIGNVPELFDGTNMTVREGKKEDVEDLKKQLKELMENRDVRLRLRDKAWKTVKNRSDKKMARQFSKVYYQVMSDVKEKPLVSIIVPTFDRGDAFLDCLAGIAVQDYPNFELVIADSGSFVMEAVARKFRTQTNIPTKYVRFEGYGKYTLAEARNRAVIEAQGEYLVFCDDRLKLEPNCISEFISNAKSKTWFWGTKDNTTKDFVENLSCVKRSDLIRAGMFNERMDHYGGMSQEIRTRFAEQGFGFEFIGK